MTARRSRLGGALLVAGGLGLLLGAGATPEGARVLPAAPQPSAVKATLVVTTTMLESAARELTPAIPELEVVTIIPPSGCPGHFDLSPRILPDLKRAQFVVRHDYQGVLEEKLERLGAQKIEVAIAQTHGSPLIPRHYAEIVDELARIIAARYPERRPALQKAAQDARTRVESLGRRLQSRAERLGKMPLVASRNQQDFIRWLGLTVAGELGRPEDISPREYEQLLQLKVGLVVGNLQEGTAAAHSLGEKLGVPVVVLSNFPGAQGFGSDYDALLAANLSALVQAWPKS